MGNRHKRIMLGEATQFTVRSKPDPGEAAKWKMRRDLLEPTIGLEPMTCRLRIDPLRPGPRAVQMRLWQPLVEFR